MISNRYYSLISSMKKTSTPAVDTDAQAFITAASITDSTQQSAINQLVLDLKTASIWTKMKAIYPFVGGTASQHRFNLKDPRALDAAYYLTFYGGGTHSATGYKPNGNSYADTKLKPTDMAQNSAHMSIYLRTNIDNGVDIGCNSATNRFWISANVGTGIRPLAPLNLPTYAVTGPNLDTRAFYLASRTNSTTNKIFRNASLNYNETGASAPPEAYNIYLGAGNLNNSGWLYSLREQAFASIGDGLSDTEATAFYNAVQAYQTTLGRQV